MENNGRPVVGWWEVDENISRFYKKTFFIS
jgi:hypothetical protein